jgi:hypothetical protein
VNDFSQQVFHANLWRNRTYASAQSQRTNPTQDRIAYRCFLHSLAHTRLSIYLSTRRTCTFIYVTSVKGVYLNDIRRRTKQVTFSIYILKCIWSPRRSYQCSTGHKHEEKYRSSTWAPRHAMKTCGESYVSRINVRGDKWSSPSHITVDGQSTCLSWCRAPSGTHAHILLMSQVWLLRSLPRGAPHLTTARVCHLQYAL